MCLCVCVFVCLQAVSVQVLAVWTGHVTWCRVTPCVGAVSRVPSATSVHRATSTTRSASVSHLRLRFSSVVDLSI